MCLKNKITRCYIHSASTQNILFFQKLITQEYLHEYVHMNRKTCMSVKYKKNSLWGQDTGSVN